MGISAKTVGFLEKVEGTREVIPNPRNLLQIFVCNEDIFFSKTMAKFANVNMNRLPFYLSNQKSDDQ